MCSMRKEMVFCLEEKLNISMHAKDDGVNEAEKEARGESTMPELFRYLTKEVPDSSVWWPWFVVPELTTLILLASVVLAIAEAAVPNSINSQPYLLTVGGLIGYAAVGGFSLCLSSGLFCSEYMIFQDSLEKGIMYHLHCLRQLCWLVLENQPWVRVLTYGFSYLSPFKSTFKWKGGRNCD